MARCRKAHTRDKRTRKAGECVLRYVQARAGANVITTFDYVIVGAGSAGCVLANRLSADPDAQILLIEAGGPDKHPFIRMPRALARVMGKPDYIWPFTTQP